MILAGVAMISVPVAVILTGVSLVAASVLLIDVGGKRG